MATYNILQVILLCSLFHNESGATARPVSDSLRIKDYSYLFSKISSSKGDPEIQMIYLDAFLKNAKSDKDWGLILTGYKNYADHAQKHELAIAYADSMVYAGLQSRNTKLIGSAYLSRGIAYYALKKHEMALENYLLASPYIWQSNDDYLKYKLKYNVAHVKYYLGNNDEAITLFSSCLDFFKANNARAYLNTLHALGLCHTKAGNYAKSEALAALGLQEAGRFDEHSMDAYFRHLKGQNDYFSRNYASAIRELKGSMPAIEDNSDYANAAVAHFYIGKSYWALKKFREGLPHLHKVAEAFEQREYIRPDLRENFELLIEYYKNRDNSQKVLFYVDRLLKADSILIKTHDNLYDSLHKNYDTRELLQEKQHIQKQLSAELFNRKALMVGACLLFLTICLLLIFYERNRRKQNKLYRNLLENKKAHPKTLHNVAKELGIAQDTVEKILRNLEKWESSEKFLGVEITQTTLAVHLNTNTRYLSEIILAYRGKKFNEYINDLKVDYVVEQLRSDKLKRMYTHDALAQEAGFSTTKRFVQAFKARTGLSPNFFSAKIRKELYETSN